MQDQGFGKFGFYRGFSPWLVGGSPLAVSKHGFSVPGIPGVCVSKFLLIKTHVRLD